MNYQSEAVKNQSKNPADLCFALLVSAMFCQGSLLEYFRVVIVKIPLISALSDLFFPILYFFLVIGCLRSGRFRWVRVQDIGILAFFTVAILVTILLYPKNAQYIQSSLWSALLPCIPFFFLGLCLESQEETFDIVGKFSCLAIFASLLYLIYFLSSGRVLGGSHGEDYSMYWSYLLLPNTLIAMDYAFRCKKWIPILSTVIGVLYAFAMGTRGPVVVLGVFLAICIWRSLRISPAQKFAIALVFAGLLLAFVFSPLYVDVLKGLKEFLVDMGVSTRVVDYLISGEMLSETSGRDDIYLDLLNHLKESPIFGYGVYGEYPVGYEAGAHNIYLQVLFHFGYPLGSILIVAFVALFIKAIRSAVSPLSRGWLSMFGCMVFARGFFGGSYLDYTLFFLLGMVLKEIRQAKENKINKEKAVL